MKMNKLSMLILVVMSFLCGTAYAAEDFLSFNLTPADCGGESVSATKGDGTLHASGNGSVMEIVKWDDDTAKNAPRMQGKKLKSGWGEGGYWLIELSTVGVENISFSAEMFSTGKAPRDFSLEYSENGTDYYPISSSGVELSSEITKVYNEFPLPKEAENLDKLYLKIKISSNFSVNGGSINGVKDGSTYINNIIFSSSESIKPDTNAPSPEAKRVFYEKRENKLENKWGTATGKYRFVIKN